MSNFKLTSNEKEKGKVVYNVGILRNIVSLAVADVEGALPTQGKKKGITLRLERESIYADVSVAVKYGQNVPELAYRIQQSVKQSVENMTRYKVAEVNVHIEDVVFCLVEPVVAVEKEDAPEESEEK